MNPIYNGRSRDRPASRNLLGEFGNETINKEDSHREDRPSVSAASPGERRSRITATGESTVSAVMSTPKRKTWLARLEKAQNEPMYITKKPSHGVGGRFFFEVTFIFPVVRAKILELFNRFETLYSHMSCASVLIRFVLALIPNVQIRKFASIVYSFCFGWGSPVHVYFIRTHSLRSEKRIY